MEYRPGFKECTDCGVALVENLADRQPEDGVPSNPNAKELFWSGYDPRIFQQCQMALHGAGIEFTDQTLAISLGQFKGARPMEIWTLVRDHDAAEKVFREVIGTSDSESDRYQTRMEPSWMRAWATKSIKAEDSQEQGTPELGDSEEPEEHPADDILEDFDPEDATAQVWSGDAREMAQILNDCLRENGIGSVIDSQRNATKLLVLPKHEARAKEIIREVIEATPPE